MSGPIGTKPTASRSRRIAVASLFGVIVWLVQGFLPAPTSDYLIAVEALFLALSFLVVGRGGATYVGAVSGLLISVVKAAFFPFDLIFAIFFGLLVDGLGIGLRAKNGGNARTGRLVVVMTVSTGVVGFVAYYLTAVATKLVPNNFFLDLSILIFGTISGAIGGYVAARIWNKNLKSRFQSQA
jgi:membrane associated rhomboid family serine protease